MDLELKQALALVVIFFFPGTLAVAVIANIQKPFRRWIESRVARLRNRDRDPEVVAHAPSRPLSGDVRARYLEQWRRILQRFEGEPSRALAEAEWLATELMRKLGPPEVALQLSGAAAPGEDAWPDEGSSPAVGELVGQVREARDATQLATSSSRVVLEDLRPTIQIYGRVIEQLLAAD